MNLFVLSSWTLLKREMVRFVRQGHRIVGALGTPLVFWLIIGLGLGKSFQAPVSMAAAEPVSYLHYFFPGTVVMILLFTAIFSTISIIEDRREGFLQGVLVSPAPRSAIALGKILGGTVLATLQGLVFMVLAPFIGIRMDAVSFAYVLTMMFFISFGLTGLGFLIAWRLDSTQGFHAIMNLFLMPMWILSGSLFPATGAPGWLQTVMALNPLTYGVAAIHQGFFGINPSLPLPMGCLLVTLIFSVVMFGAAVWSTAQTERGGAL